MNLLSLFSFFNFVCFLLSILYLFRITTRSKEVKAFILTNLSLAIWTFAYTFFYVAGNKEMAWFWHKIGIIGGYGFPCFSVYYYLVLTKTLDRVRKPFRYLLFVIIPILLASINLLSPNTSCATDLVRSTSGLGWTYINSPKSILYWVYIIYVFLYFSFGFYLVAKWGRNTNVKQYQTQSKILVYLFGFVLSLGMITDFVLPMFTSILPPTANLLLVFVIYGDWLILDRYSFFSVSQRSNSHIILNTITDAVIMINGQRQIVRVNPATTEMFGYAAKDLINKDSSVIFLDKERQEEYIADLIKKKRIKNKEADIIAADGRIITTIISASVAEDGNHDFLGIVVSFHDITERKKMERMWKEEKEKYKKLAKDYLKLANYDVLTGLPNRRMFFDTIKKTHSETGDKQSCFTLIFMDLNRFKQINDQYGHDVGDKILIETANRLSKCIDKDDLLARLGGDEFVILIPDHISNSFAEKRIEFIKNQFVDPIIINDMLYKISIAVGYALFPNENHNIDELFRDADIAMYRDKQVSESDVEETT
ncbi:MAG: diguanylate cyclase [Mobilitalea sp.]